MHQRSLLFVAAAAALAATAAADTILITGANGGIGAALAVRFAAAGNDVFAACRSKSAHVHAAVAAAGLEKNVHVLLGLDVTDQAKTDAFVKALKERDVVIDVLVTASGVATWQLAGPAYPGTTEPMTLGSLNFDLIRKVFEINAIGPLRVSEAAFAAGLLRQPGGRVAHVSSRLGSMGANTQLGANYAYRMSKAALNAAGKSMAVDLRAAPAFSSRPGRGRGRLSTRRAQRGRGRLSTRRAHTPSSGRGGADACRLAGSKGVAVALLHPGYVATPMTGDKGDLTAEASAEGLFRQITALNLTSSGSFLDTAGSVVPW